MTMKTLNRVGILIFALMLITPACHRQSQVRSSNDAALELAVHDRMDADPNAKGATAGVNVSAKAGVVTLTGTADTAADRMRAEEIARLTKGVVTVVNEITVMAPTARINLEGQFDEQAVRAQAARNGEELGATSSDARIYDQLRRKLVRKPSTPKEEIFVDVKNSNVTLRGMVFTSEARNDAVTAARRIKGVNAVNDRLLVNTELP
jgi:osmotically-inducible protein OsmY